ncbi:MAG TPA: acylneuraminate cytidylyltransferase family protein [Polyangia bacterium]|nr:acylneuraminate cytidylyltransferase family protein [Polyangia bacterium]
MSLLALIPARGGSKGVRGKNVALVAGRPLIAWTVEAARAARHVERVVVTTDSPEIAEAARAAGAEVPFLRPDELARDDTPGIAPALHATRWLDEHEAYRPELVCYLQPTSPLRRAEHIDAAVELLREKAADAAVSVTPVEHHPYWTKRLAPDGRLSDFLTPDPPITRRQDLPPLYALNGALYLVRRAVLLADETLFPPNTVGYVMTPRDSLDVDTPFDLELADLLLRARAG